MADTSFSIITFNAALLRMGFRRRPFFEPVPHVEERLAGLCRLLPGLDGDVVMLQEVFGRHVQRLVFQHARQSFPYACLDDRRSLLGSGLMILSRHPTAQTLRLSFRSSPVFARPIVSFGAVRTHVQLPGHVPVLVLNTHLTAGLMHHPESAKTNSRRSLQIDEVQEFAHRAPNAGGLAIIAGDFNAGPQASRVNYEQVVAAGFGDALSSARTRPAEPAVTWSPTNPLSSSGPHADSPPQRVDHVFYASNGQTVSVDEAEILFDDGTVSVATGERLPLSDHYGLRVRFTLGESAAE